ncbi:squalene--hopene cyclase [Bacillus testis]|uniref:squalene--hopene cyclase n=1 Tax=Bacillus testis TaxID=1622072 RepID=UPI0036F2361B
MANIYEVKDSIQRRMAKLEVNQNANGSWSYIFEGPIMTDSFTVMVMKSIKRPADQLIQRLVKRLLRLQNANGSWSLYSDEEGGNLSATIQAYSALLISGLFTRNDEEMKRAEQFILHNGGLAQAHFMTKMMLAVNGLYSYPGYFYFPMTYYLLPPSFPLSLYHCSNYARVHLTPMIICMNKKFSIQHDIDRSFFTENPHDQWFRSDRENWSSYFIDTMKDIALTPLHLHKAGYKSAKKLILDRIEANGTLYSYASSTFYMVYALLALGYRTHSAAIIKAAKGIEDYAMESSHGLHIQNSPSTVWDTALLSYSLQEAGMNAAHPVIIKSTKYLLGKQQFKRGDWAVNAPNAKGGGWGFSETNSFIPDHDDTSAALRALSRRSKQDDGVKKAWIQGKQYLLDMQNKDGGWGAFEKNAYQSILAHLPIENAKDALIDNSTSDLTGRVLEFLGNYGNEQINSPPIKKSCNWLLEQQLPNGSWYGKWGVCYIYGTWAAMTGLRAVGIPRNHKQIMKGVLWLESIQQPDGGWGESCKSAEKEEYIPLPFSTPSQTAWAVDALLSVRNPDAPSIQKGIQYLLQNENNKSEYPTGLGLPGGFYIHYGSYNDLFPLLALGHYRKKVEEAEKQ